MTRRTFALLTALTARAADAGRLFVYSQTHTAANSWIAITIDGAAVAKIQRGRYFAVSLDAGRHTVGGERSVPAMVNVGAGEDAFVRLDWSHSVGSAPVPVLKAVRREQALAEVKHLRYVDAKHIVSAGVFRTDPREPDPLELKVR